MKIYCSVWPIKYHQGSNTNKSNGQFWQKLTFDWYRRNSWPDVTESGMHAQPHPPSEHNKPIPPNEICHKLPGEELRRKACVCGCSEIQVQ